MSFLFLKPDSSSQEYGTNIFTYTMPVQPGSIYYLGAVNTVGIYDKDYTSANGFLGEWAGGSNISSVAPYTLVLHSRAGATAQDWDGTIAYLPAAVEPEEPPGAPTDARYYIWGANPALPNASPLNAGLGITLSSGGPGTDAFIGNSMFGAPIITAASFPDMSNEQVLTAGTNITLDNTVPGIMRINAAGGATGAPTTAQYLTLAADPGLANERVLTAGAGVTLDAAVPGVLTINAASSFANHKARALGNLGQTINTTTNTTVILDLESYDPNNNFANNRYTVPATGYYYVAVSVGVTGVTFMQVTLQNAIGPTNVFQYYLHPIVKDDTNTAFTGTRSDIMFLTAGAELEIVVASTLVPYDVFGASLTVHRIS